MTICWTFSYFSGFSDSRELKISGKQALRSKFVLTESKPTTVTLLPVSMSSVLLLVPGQDSAWVQHWKMSVALLVWLPVFFPVVGSLPKSKKINKWYFVNKIVLTYCEKKNSSDREKLLRFEAEGREFAKFLKSLEQFIQTVKGQNNFW